MRPSIDLPQEAGQFACIYRRTIFYIHSTSHNLMFWARKLPDMTDSKVKPIADEVSARHVDVDMSGCITLKEQLGRLQGPRFQGLWRDARLR